ncbi:MAG: T9SS type A sorting domain-containing protein [Bacteroidales bacterium]|nr:T9SS type A sorting domain-containing protein [Bacteroidales bacterium]
MKKVCALLIGLFLLHSGISQDCPPGAPFVTQTQIDNFHIDYPNCIYLEGGLWIGFGEMTLITNLDGLSNITSIDRDLIILYNPNLKDLDGLNNLKSIGGDLELCYNFSLNSLEALSSLTSIGGKIYICDSPFLTSLSGLENIDAGTITDIEFFRNNSLSYCHVKSICDYLKISNGQNLFYYNSTGCNSREEVDSACNLISVEDLDLNPAFTIYPNPASTTIIIGIPHSTAINTFLAIYNLNSQQILMRQITGPETTIDIRGLAQGVYFVRLNNDRTVQVVKLVKN